MNYTFHLTIGSTVTEVFPLNFLETSLVDEQEQNKIFYRRKFNGKLTFVNNNGDDDFDLLYAVQQTTPCSKLLFEIKKNAVNYWSGYFSVSEGDFDLNKCTFEVTPLPDDDYAELLDKADDQYNILSRTSYTTTAGAFIYTRCRMLYNNAIAPDKTKNVLEYLADNILTGVAVSSTFFTAATNPATLAASHVRYLMIAQKSDIIRNQSTDAATVAMMSWNDLMEILWGMFQVVWDYDSNTNTINVEHISFWSPSAGMDLRSQPIAKNNKFAYLKEKMPKYEKFSWMEALAENFKGRMIQYSSECVDQNPESNTLETILPVTTDLEYIQTTPLEIADEGFVVIANTYSGGVYLVERMLGKYLNEVRYNMHLSWANLHDSYYRHERVLPEGYMNGALTDFWSAQKNKSQDCFAIVCPADGYDPADYITTELGETYFGGQKGRVLSSSLNPKGEMKFQLGYSDPGVAQVPITESKWILITEGECGSFSAVLSEAADADLPIVIKYIIYDEDFNVVCSDTVDGETWTITTGLTSDTFSLTLCGVIPAGGCIRYTNIPFEVTGKPEWPIGFNPANCNCE